MQASPINVLAVAAHPDDVEFVMAGTLLLLKDAGANVYIWNLANGCYGTVTHSYHDIIRIRWEEAQASARVGGMTIFPPVVDDLGILYTPEMIARVAAVVRMVRPEIVFTHSLHDYMEDHMSTARITLAAAFCRGMPNYSTLPPVEPWDGSITVYHATPISGRDEMRKRIRPGQYVDITTMMARKREMLAQHQSQKEWLDVSQGMDSYLLEMERASAELGRQSGRFQYAEGWRRHGHQGYAPKDMDPLSEILGDKCWTDPAYEAWLDE